MQTKPKRQIKSRQRVRDLGEVFTEAREVKAMCDLCEPIISDRSQRILEPAAGNGNFLVEILARRLHKIDKRKKAAIQDFQILEAISTIYAIDIMPDNVKEARRRMLSLIIDAIGKRKSSIMFLRAINAILKVNIIRGDSLKKKMWKELELNGTTIWQPDLPLKLYEWTPSYEDLTFSVTEWSMNEIEKRAKSTRIATVSELSDVLSELGSDGVHEANHPKPRNHQATSKTSSSPMLFDIIKKGA